MNTQTMISYLQSSVDKRANLISHQWQCILCNHSVAEHNTFKIIRLNNTKSFIKQLEQKQKIEKKILRTLISTKRMLKQEML